MISPTIRRDSDRVKPRVLLAVLLAVALGACQTLPDDAFRLTESALELREIQTRSIEGISEVEILAASSGVLQDLGYTIDEVEKELGVLSASKRANAKEATEILGKIALDVADCMLTFLLGCENDSYQSSKDVQDIRMTLVVLPNLEKEGEYQVRLTMQRIVWAKSGEVYAQETINDATIYQAFFDKLSKSVFLEKEGV